MTFAITEAQRENMHHALGLDNDMRDGAQPYRNFFWTDADSVDGETWAPLVAAGLAWQSKPQKGFGDMCMFAVTDDGLQALGITDLSGLEPRERFKGRPATAPVDGGSDAS